MPDNSVFPLESTKRGMRGRDAHLLPVDGLGTTSAQAQRGSCSRGPRAHQLLPWRANTTYDQRGTRGILYTHFFQNSEASSLVSKGACVLSLFSVSDSVRPHGLQPTRLLCPWGFSKQEYWSGLPCSPSANLPDPEIKPHLLHLLHWQVGSLPLAPSGKPFMDQSQVNQALICMQGCLSWSLVVSKAGNHWDFPGGPVDKTPYFQ